MRDVVKVLFMSAMYLSSEQQGEVEVQRAKQAIELALRNQPGLVSEIKRASRSGVKNYVKWGMKETMGQYNYLRVVIEMFENIEH